MSCSTRTCTAACKYYTSRAQLKLLNEIASLSRFGEDFFSRTAPVRIQCARASGRPRRRWRYEKGRTVLSFLYESLATAATVTIMCACIYIKSNQVAIERARGVIEFISVNHRHRAVGGCNGVPRRDDRETTKRESNFGWAFCRLCRPPLLPPPPAAIYYTA